MEDLKKLLPNYEIKREYDENSIHYIVLERVFHKGIICPKCNNNTTRVDNSYVRQVEEMPINKMRVIILINMKIYICKCSKQGFLDKEIRKLVTGNYKYSNSVVKYMQNLRKKGNSYRKIAVILREKGFNIEFIHIQKILTNERNKNGTEN
jgi:hypothetical protein